MDGTRGQRIRLWGPGDWHAKRLSEMPVKAITRMKSALQTLPMPGITGGHGCWGGPRRLCSD
jgi:hypothetical protein